MGFPRLLAGVVAVSLKQVLAHRADFLFRVLLASTGAVAGLGALGFVYARASSLAGWGLGEAIVVLGTFQIVSGVLAAFVEPNLAWFAGQVRTGALDDVLLRPVPSILFASLGRCDPLGMAQVGLGFGVVVVGLHESGASPTPGAVAGWLVLLWAAVAAAWATRLLVACVGFWAPYVEPDVLYGAVWQFGRYPVDIYQPAVRRLLTYGVPMASIASVPARVLTRGADAAVLAGSLAATLGLVVTARLVWAAGLRRYTSATS